MFSTTHPFFVGKPNADGTYQLRDAEFRFNIKSTRLLEQACHSGLDYVIARGQNVEALVLLTTYGLMWDPDLKMTQAKAEDLLQKFIDAKQDVGPLYEKLHTALRKSGVYGVPIEDPKPAPPTAEGEEEPVPLG